MEVTDAQTHSRATLHSQPGREDWHGQSSAMRRNSNSCLRLAKNPIPSSKPPLPPPTFISKTHAQTESLCGTQEPRIYIGWVIISTNVRIHSVNGNPWIARRQRVRRKD